MPTKIGAPGNDKITGTASKDAIYGRNGNGLLDGSLNNDGMYGEQGSDTLWGKDGDDRLFGRTGNDLLERDGSFYGHDDVLTGGAGRDIFQMRVAFLDDFSPENDDAQGGGIELVTDFARGTNGPNFVQENLGGSRQLTFAKFDSNHDGRLNEADKSADFVQLDIDDTSKSSLVIDLAKVDAVTVDGKLALGSYAFIAELEVFGVTTLTANDFASPA